MRDVKLQFNFKLDMMSPYEFGTILYGLVFYGEKMSKELKKKIIEYYEMNRSHFDANTIACTTWCLVKYNFVSFY